MSGFRGEYLGFSLGGVHSSQLNITRVVSGSRYQETLLPEFSDATTQIPGGDGIYYWNTSYTQKRFTINFAFDDLDEGRLLKLKQLLGFKGIQELIFDEAPHKKYLVKCGSPPNFNFIPFGKDGDILIYKGEGVLNLVAYYPYAISTKEKNISSNTQSSIINLGDMETPFQIYYLINQETSIELKLNNEVKLKIEGLLLKSNSEDKYICIDTRTHLIEGLDVNYNKTGNLYNQYIDSGDFFNFPIGLSTIKSDIEWNKIKFNYLYY